MTTVHYVRDDDELASLHRAGTGLIYNDFSGQGATGAQYNVLHTTRCSWVAKQKASVRKIFFATTPEALAWLTAHRGTEGKNWKRCGRCRAEIDSILCAASQEPYSPSRGVPSTSERRSAPPSERRTEDASQGVGAIEARVANSRQQGGLRGVYLVAAELSRLGYSVAPTARNAAGADLLVFDPATSRAASIEVKTNAKRASFWLVGERAQRSRSPSHFYTFLNIAASREGGEVYEYYLVPSTVVAQETVVQQSSTGSIWYSFMLKSAEKYRDAWDQLHSA
jgi:hypothetical protein